jgi:hypothetical protein
MPNLDGTGPLGKGPMTGRKLGNCAKGQSTPAAGIGPCGKVRGTGTGRGRGTGRGAGRGRNA